MRLSTDCFLSGRLIPAWAPAWPFLSAYLGAQEVIAMAASGAKYGIMISHFYWMGAIPAMVFVALLMMSFYYGSKARSVAEYLKLRFDEKTRSLNAVSLATITVFPLASLCTRWRCSQPSPRLGLPRQRLATAIIVLF